MNNDSRSRSPLSSDELLRPILGERHPGTFSQQRGMFNVTTLNQDLTKTPAVALRAMAGLRASALERTAGWKEDRS
jgi:hypothetical protein